ncbi:MAG TPA: hypothetical protein VJS30_22705 [Paraburkholderia sp.]|nr:hypothetical protein [Paraburkholderia sp.]
MGDVAQIVPSACELPGKHRLHAMALGWPSTSSWRLTHGKRYRNFGMPLADSARSGFFEIAI